MLNRAATVIQHSSKEAAEVSHLSEGMADSGREASVSAEVRGPYLSLSSPYLSLYRCLRRCVAPIYPYV